MNFFNVGFVLCAINFNLGLWVTYALKLIGCLFMIGGIKEMNLFDKSYNRFSPYVYLTLALSATGTVLSVLMTSGVIKGTAENIISIAVGVPAILSVVYTQYAILKQITPNHTLVNDPSLLARLSDKWKWMTFFTLLNLLCDILHRLLPQGTAGNMAGTVQFIAFFPMYIYIGLMCGAFNRVRMDFNVMHPTD